MTRQELIERWADIAEAVFWAEEAISKDWYQKLQAAPSLTKHAQHQLAKDYCQAIAVEITKSTPDEVLDALN